MCGTACAGEFTYKSVATVHCKINLHDSFLPPELIESQHIQPQFWQVGHLQVKDDRTGISAAIPLFTGCNILARACELGTPADADRVATAREEAAELAGGAGYPAVSFLELCSPSVSLTHAAICELCHSQAIATKRDAFPGQTLLGCLHVFLLHDDFWYRYQDVCFKKNVSFSR